VTRGVILQVCRLEPIVNGTLNHSLVVIGLLHPLNSLIYGCDRTCRNLSINRLRQSPIQITLNRLLILHHFHIFVHFLMLCQNDSFSLSIILRSTSTTEDLLHIENTNILERALRRIINFGPLDDYPVRGQVHTPGERGRGAEDFDVPVSEEVFDEVAVFAEHAGVVGGEAEVEQFFYLEVAGGDHLFFLGVGLFAIK